MRRPNNSLGRQLVEMRQNAGLSQRQVSDHMGYGTAQFISNWERGISEPPIDRIPDLADLYHVDADYLFGLVRDHRVQNYAKQLNDEWKSIK